MTLKKKTGIHRFALECRVWACILFLITIYESMRYSNTSSNRGKRLLKIDLYQGLLIFPGPLKDLPGRFTVLSHATSSDELMNQSSHSGVG